MSLREWDRAGVIRRVAPRELSQQAAAVQLGLSTRQIKRLVRAWRDAGDAGLVSRRRGKPSNRRIKEAVREAALERLRSDYEGFGPTLAAEYLASEHGFPHSVETLRQWMIAADLWTPRRRRLHRTHAPRERRPRRGELVQIDGSPHDWLEGRGPRCSLIAFMDDATSEVLAGGFWPTESSRAYLTMLETYVRTHGRPVALYSDRHGIFTKHDPEDLVPTQLQRATETLDIALIHALNPQAKGRVEQLFLTLQDRLTKAMRLAGISTLEQANAFLVDYLPSHDARFARPATEHDDAHRACALDAQTLRHVCSIQHRRTLSKDLVLKFKGQRYIIQTHAGAPR